MCSRCRSSGAVMVITLLAVMLLAAMVFYIFNVGHHVAAKVETQNAADAAAVSGARWVARSFNTVAMNNVETTRLIAYVAVLDAVPQAVEYTIIDQETLLQAIEAQLRRDPGTDVWLRDGLTEAQINIERQLGMLRPINELFEPSEAKAASDALPNSGGGYDVAAMTHYHAPGGGRGQLWEAIDALAGLSAAAMQDVNDLAATAASSAAATNQQSGTGGGAMLSWTSEVPWEQGGFGDFRLPVLTGRLPPGQDDPESNRGPFDTLFGFREFRFGAGSGERVLDRSGDTLGVSQDFRLTGWVRPRRDPYDGPGVDIPGVGRVGRPIRYDTYGAYRHMRQSGMDMARGPLGHASRYQQAWSDPGLSRQYPLAPSSWARHLSFIADRKINYCFPGLLSNRVARRPQWVLDYDQASQIIEAGQPVVAHARYLVFTYYRDEFDADAMTPAGPPILRDWGLVLPEGDLLEPPGLTKVADHVWRDERVETRRRLGVEGSGAEQTEQGDEPDAEASSYTRRYFRYYVFAGVQVGEGAAVRNPFNFDAEDRNTIAGPVNFPPEVRGLRRRLSPNDFGRDDRGLTYLGVAYQPKAAPFWSSRFDGDRPDHWQVSVAQAEVFNNHSWDLWTQMWHAQLTPIDRYGEWLDLMDDAGYGQPAGQDVPETIREYLRATQPLVELMARP